MWYDGLTIVCLAFLAFKCAMIADNEMTVAPEHRDQRFVWMACALAFFLMWCTGLLGYHAYWKV